jgi:TonB family protein
MSLDFEDYRPETPSVPSAISVREGVLISLVFHLALALFLVLGPKSWFEATPEVVQVAQKEPMRYVQVMPAIDRTELAKRLAELSDQDRRSKTPEIAPKPENVMPLARGNTPERTVSTPEVKAAGPETPNPPAPPSPPAPQQAALGDTAAKILNDPMPRPPARQSGGQLGQAFRNLQQYLQTQNFDNPNSSGDEPSADIQFDSKGVDFGPWLRRFVAQIRRNWLIPQVAEMSKGRTAIQFTVLKSGMIVDIHVSQPAGIDALTLSALNAIKLSNPTSALPPEFPDDRAPFTVTFHYNEGPRESP